MKKLVNNIHSVVKGTLEGLAPAHVDLAEVHLDPDFVTRKTPKAEGKVGLVSGGGSDHKPLHTGFVDEGMLNAAVPGAVFTSSTSDPILEVTKAADCGAGVLHIVKNHTSSVLSFETITEIAEMESIEVRSIVVNDDAAVEDSPYTTDRRGVVDTILVEKLAGAAAKRGDDSDVVTAVVQKTNSETHSMSLVLGPCTVLCAGKPSFDLADDEIELGIGIHGEPGYRCRKMENANAPAEKLCTKVRDDPGLKAREHVITLVNGMGNTPSSELYVHHCHSVEFFEADGASIARSLVGNYVTSLETPDVSITLLRIDDKLFELFDISMFTLAWKWGTHNDSRRRMGDPVDAVRL